LLTCPKLAKADVDPKFQGTDKVHSIQAALTYSTESSYTHTMRDQWQSATRSSLPTCPKLAKAEAPVQQKGQETLGSIATTQA
jgi:hypothetical protein